MSGTRTAVVTGASAGIGAAIARALGALGWPVALGARRTPLLQEVGRDVEAAGGRAFSHVLDVTDAVSIDAFFGTAEQALGPIDVVVSNAGIGRPGLLHEVPIAELEHEIRTNLLGPMLVARRALPAMLERRRGDLVFVSSMNVVEPRPFQLGYTASKAGVEGMAQVLRRDLEGTGVRSTIVRPGATRSEFGFGWEPDILVRVLDAWKQWGFMRHLDMMGGDQVALAVVAAVTAPPGLHMDVIQVSPERRVGGD
ncbi:MAG: SDR family NAD(P)-dependent oxidoreductase [Deltaproteobacteria bacterium]|nr:SDR family NAD(P)-dependent oxidoreductase [Deltaproteobacteria bacterium]